MGQSLNNRFWLLDAILWVGIASVTGMLVVIALYLVSYGYDTSHLIPAPLFPLAATAWEECDPFRVTVCLLAACSIIGYLRPGLWWLLGPSTTTFFFAFAIAEMKVSPSSHNLWPIEFVLYLVFIGGPATIGCLFGAFFAARRRRIKQRVA